VASSCLQVAAEKWGEKKGVENCWGDRLRRKKKGKRIFGSGLLGTKKKHQREQVQVFRKKSEKLNADIRRKRGGSEVRPSHSRHDEKKNILHWMR